jgi:hypothetical protein
VTRISRDRSRWTVVLIVAATTVLVSGRSPDGPASAAVPGTAATGSHAGHQSGVSSPQSSPGRPVDYRPVLGEPFRSTVVTRFVRDNGCRGDGARYRCSTAGLELLVKDGRVYQAVLVGPHVRGFFYYTGTLPAGLDWSDNRVEVEQKLGRPPIFVPSSRYARAVSTYPKLWLSLTFDPAAGSSPAAELCHVYVTAPT